MQCFSLNFKETSRKFVLPLILVPWVGCAALNCSAAQPTPGNQDENPLSATNISNLTAESNPSHLFWKTVPALGTGVPAIVFGLLATVYLTVDLKKNATLVKKLVLLLMVSNLFGVLGIFGKVIYLFLCMPGHDNAVLCSLVNFWIVFFILLSGAIAMTMSIDRCLALRAPFWYARNQMGNRIFVPLGLVSVGLAVICFIPNMAGTVFKKRIRDGKIESVCGTFPNEQVSSAREAVFPLTLAAILMLMVMVNVSCNVLVMQTMRKMVRVIPWYNEIQGTTEEFRMTKMLMSLSIAFLVCYIPLVIDLVLTQAGVVVPAWIKIFTQVLSAYSYTVHPCVYLFVNEKYRQRITNMCRRNACTLKARVP